MSASDLLDSLLATPVVRCDEIAWSFANISMAGWNMLFSSGLACFALLAYRKTK
jgi:disulfide bond formation protein DsbB